MIKSADSSEAFCDEDRFSIIRATKLLMRATLGLGVLMAIAIIAVATTQANITAMKEYNALASSAAWAAVNIINPRQIDKWLVTKEADDAWVETNYMLHRMVDEFDLEYGYVCYVEAPKYTHITYIFNNVNEKSGFTAFPLGYVQDYENEQYSNSTRKVFEKGETVIRYVMHDKSGAHITANAPLMDNNGHVVAMIGVRKSMAAFVRQRHFYILVMNLAMLALSALFMLIVQMLFKRIVLRPVSVHNVRLRMAMDAAENANHAKSRFLATMSHEIRTPMNAIVGFSELSLRDDAPPAVRGRLERINRASRALLAIINDILDYSKIEAGKMDLVPVNYSLDTLMKDVSSIVKVRISSTSVRLVIDRDPLMPPYLFGDDARIRQILINLGGNAAKFTENGEIRLSVSLHEGSPLPGDEGSEVLVDWSVKDTGIGIKEEDLGKLFGAFSQVNMAQNRGKEGTGLGLAICKQLVNLMGGEMNVKSTYGKGSVFYFTIPQKAGREIEERNEERRKEQFTCPAAKVLLVDDNEVNLLVAQGYLAPYKCAITTAGDGMSAVRIARDSQFDIIFMDHMMPGIDGEQATHAIRVREGITGRHECIVALTADVSSDAKEVFCNKGFDDYLAKPMDSSELDRVMREHIPKEKAVIEKAEDIESTCKIENTNKMESTKAAREAAESSTAVQAVDKDVLRLFFSQAGSKIAIIRECAAVIGAKEGDDKEDALKRYRIEVHALKSSAKVCGFDEVSALAAAAEKAAKENDIAYIAERNDTLLEKYEGLLKQNNSAATEKLEETAKSRNTFESAIDAGNGIADFSTGEGGFNNTVKIDTDTLLTQLQQAASTGDVVTLEEKIGQLRALTSELQAACDDMDTEKAVKILQQHGAEASA